MTVFKVGDRVKIVKPDSRFDGNLGTIEDKVNKSVYLVKPDNSKHNMFFMDYQLRKLALSSSDDNKDLWEALDDE